MCHILAAHAMNGKSSQCKTCVCCTHPLHKAEIPLNKASEAQAKQGEERDLQTIRKASGFLFTGGRESQRLQLQGLHLSHFRNTVSDHLDLANVREDRS